MRALNNEIKETFADEFDKAYEEYARVGFETEISAEEKVEEKEEQKSASVPSSKLEDFKASSKMSEPFEQAFALVLEGARRGPMTTTSAGDLTETPRELSESPDAKTLHPYQLAGAGRMQYILEKHKSVLLAWETKLGKTLTVVAHLLNVGFMSPEPAKPHGPVLIILSTALIKPWLDTFKEDLKSTPRVCVYRNSSGNKDDPDLEGVTYTTNLTPLELCDFDVVLATYTAVRLEHQIMLDTVHKQRKHKNGRRLRGELKTSLICALQAFSLRLRVGDDFNGERAARFEKVKSESCIWKTAQEKSKTVEVLLDPDYDELANARAARDWSYEYFRQIMSSASQTALPSTTTKATKRQPKSNTAVTPSELEEDEDQLEYDPAVDDGDSQHEGGFEDEDEQFESEEEGE
ncbi:hypothetical protein N0V86_009252 [Didymella sp. IMI 355093]|nr:hypothetical protein N0V86_009252 [Didymella sp. IMI 355093]